MGKSKISWCDYTWNSIAGCTKVSAGCAHCWAERVAFRLKRRGQRDYQSVVDDEGHWTGHVVCLEHRLEQPLHWRKPRRIFVASMSDLFHPLVPFDFIAQVFDIMASPRAEQHTFMLLTKRPDRAGQFYNWLRARFEAGGFWSGDTALGLALEERWPLPNVWLGVSVENENNLWRVEELLRMPAAVRWASYEPALGPVDFSRYLGEAEPDMSTFPRHNWDYWRRSLPWKGLAWLIIGAESGPGRRPFEEQWAWDVLDQCRKAGIPCFLKQDSGPGPGVPLLDREGREVKEFPSKPV